MLLGIILAILSINASAGSPLWNYGAYDYFGWSVPASDYIYPDGSTALEALGKEYWSGLHGDSTYYFRNLSGMSCNSTNTQCSSQCTYERCYTVAGNSPATRGLWNHSSYTFNCLSTPESGYTYATYQDALTGLGTETFDGKVCISTNSDGTTSTTSYSFLGLANVYCNISSDTSGYCMADPILKICNGSSCSTQTPLIHMIARSGNCPIYTPISYIYANQDPSKYFLQSDADDIDQIVKNFNLGKPLHCKGRGNPIQIVNGNKYQAESDLRSSSVSGLHFQRYYNSQSNDPTSLGNNWRDNYMAAFTPFYPPTPTFKSSSNQSSEYSTAQDACQSGWAQIKDQYTSPLYKNAVAIYENGQCNLYNNNKFIRTISVYSTLLLKASDIEYDAYRPDGRVVRFKPASGNTYLAKGMPGMRLTKTTDGFELIRPDNTVEIYVGTQLQSITHPDGIQEILHYTNNLLDSVTDNVGNVLNFTYNADNRIASVNYNGVQQWGYRYDANGNLQYVDNPDGTTRQYLYENASYVHALTGIDDERNKRFASFSYDSQGRAITTYHATNVERVDLTYNGDGSTTVTNSRNVASTYTFDDTIVGKEINTVTGPGCTSCGLGNSSFEFDITNDLLSAKTIHGLRTEYYNYDANGNPGYIIYAAGTAQARRTDYTYDPRFISKTATKTEPSVCATGNKVTTYGYDDFADLTSITIDGFTPDCTAISRTTTLQYNGPLHQLSLIDGPRTDVIDVTTFEYYLDDPSEGNNRARLKSVTLANGTVARDNIQYSATGKILGETRPNGLTLSYTYYPGNDRLQTLTQSDGTGSRTTRWTYLPTGEVETITLGDGSLDATSLTFDYDEARRLKRITDALGNYIEYTLDTEDNQTARNIHDTNGTLRRALSQTFDVYDKLESATQENESYQYTFAPDGTLSNDTDGNLTNGTYSYDALKRLMTITQDVGGSDTSTANALTTYGYDVHDNLTSVTDPNNGGTTYTYDDLGNQLSVTSPDTYNKVMTYDAAGNLITLNDFKNGVFQYHYDALNRLVSLDEPRATNNTVYTYDTCANGVGRLCSVTQGTTTVSYAYDGFGDVTSHQSIQYAYDVLGRVKTMTYPSGNSVTYHYAANGQVDTVDAVINGVPQSLASNINYAPFGPITSLTYGNGAQLTQAFDTAYRMQSQSIPGVYQRDYTQYDGNGNLKAMSIVGQASNNAYSYDALNRVTGATGTFGSQTFHYDLNGNRTQAVNDGTTDDYSYTPNTNRLIYINSADVSTNVLGNIDFIHGIPLGYDAFNRVIGTSGVTYQYNGLNQRIGKTVNNVPTTYLYGLRGELLAELDGNGQTQAEYYYLNGKPLAATLTSVTPPPVVSDIIIDDGTAGTTSSNGWRSKTDSSQYGADYLYSGSRTNRWHQWSPTLTQAGQYDVYAWYVAGSNNSTSAPYSITHAGVTDTVTLDQTANGGQWVLLGRYQFDANGSENIQLTSANGAVTKPVLTIFIPTS